MLNPPGGDNGVRTTRLVLLQWLLLLLLLLLLLRWLMAICHADRKTSTTTGARVHVPNEGHLLPLAVGFTESISPALLFVFPFALVSVARRCQGRRCLLYTSDAADE